MPYKYTVKQGDTLNGISQSLGFSNYKEAGVSSVPSGNFDLIRPGETIDFANYDQPAQFDTTADRTAYEKNSKTFEDKYGTTPPVDTTGAEGGAPTVTQEIPQADGSKLVVYSDGTTQKVAGDGSSVTPDQAIENQKNKDVTDATAKAQADADYATSELDRIGAKMSANSKNLIESIKATYGSRIALMEDTNKRLLAGKEQAGYQSGRSRYMSGVQQGILTDEEQNGIDRVSKLEGEMLSLIVEAETAQTQEELDIFNEKMDRINEINDNLQTELTNIQKEAYNKLQEMRDQKKADIDAEDARMQLIYDRSKEGAPAVATQLENYGTPEEKAAFLEEYSKATGIPMDVLMTDIQEYATAEQKANLDLENTQSLIESRKRTAETASRNADTSAARLELDKQKNEFNPSSDEKAKVGKYAAANLSPEDMDAALKDRDYFYYILSLADAEEL